MPLLILRNKILWGKFCVVYKNKGKHIFLYNQNVSFFVESWVTMDKHDIIRIFLTTELNVKGRLTIRPGLTRIVLFF